MISNTVLLGLERTITADISSPCHSVQLTAGQFVICHGPFISDLHRVCVLDDDANVTHSYGS